MQSRAKIDELFDRQLTYPDCDAQDRITRLIGLDEQINRLCKIISLLVNPTGLLKWANDYHPNVVEDLPAILRRPPLVILVGDVGSGKTELAETIGDTVARRENIDITLFPLSLSSRGQGLVGEMTQLLSAAFNYTESEAKKLVSQDGPSRGAVILLVDEADALAQSREIAQMHHEDRAGVNAFIRGIDMLASSSLPAVVIMCTNRPGALDPAVKRRAAEILTFTRPDDSQRNTVLAPLLTKLGFNWQDIDEIVSATGPLNGRGYGFTFSDLTQRLIPAIILDAYPDNTVCAQRAKVITYATIPTPPFQDDAL